MLIVTWTGLVANTDYVAYLALKKQPAEDLEAAPSPRYRALLCFPNADSIVAAGNLTLEAARFLRADIAHRWADGERLLDVNEALRRYADGAYYAQDAGEGPEEEASQADYLSA